MELQSYQRLLSLTHTHSLTERLAMTQFFTPWIFSHWTRSILLGIGAIAGSFYLSELPAQAQISQTETTDEPITSSAEERRIRLLSIPDAMERAFFEHDPNYFDNQTLDRQLGWMFYNFPENEVEADGALVDVVLKDLMHQQSYESPPIRTQDLTNPYTTSLETMPGSGSSPPIRGSEFIIPPN
jgi:hypothetical protein